ncbi:MAG TPA: oligosaccharide flippase family protein [Polyangiaceae bacterium]
MREFDDGPVAPQTVSTGRSLGFVYVGYAFRYLQLIVLVPYYGRVLGASEYGHVLAAMSLYQVVWMLSEFGFPPVGARDAASTTDVGKLSQIYGRHVVGRATTMLVGVAVGLLATRLSPVLRERPIFGVLATLSGIVAAFNLGWFYQGMLRFRTSVMLEVLGFVLNLPLVLLFVRGPHDGAGVLLALLISGTICTIAAHAIAVRGLRFRDMDWSGGFELIRGSTALFAHRGLVALLASSSTYLISLFASATEVGYYGAAERLVSAALSLLNPANQVLVGTVARHIGSRDNEDRAYALMRAGFISLSLLGTSMLVGTLLLANILVPLILGEAFVDSIPILRVLALMFPFAIMDQVITGYVMIPLRLDRVVIKVSFQAAVATIALMAMFGYGYGGLGVAWARTLGSLLMALSLLHALQSRQILKRIFGS